jgi:hypothetical protein
MLQYRKGKLNYAEEIQRQFSGSDNKTRRSVAVIVDPGTLG